MKRIINPCFYGNAYREMFIKITYKDKKLSISGVIGPKNNGDAYCCGQILEELHNSDNELKEGWTPEMIYNLYMAWKNWHLNYLRAGCIHQRELRWEDVRINPRALPKNKIANRDEKGILAIWVKEDEHKDGKLCKPCPVCGYEYGTSWLFEEVPEKIIDFLFSLPETKKQPAWV